MGESDLFGKEHDLTPSSGRPIIIRDEDFDVPLPEIEEVGEKPNAVHVASKLA